MAKHQRFLLPIEKGRMESEELGTMGYDGLQDDNSFFVKFNKNQEDCTRFYEDSFPDDWCPRAWVDKFRRFYVSLSAENNILSTKVNNVSVIKIILT